MASVVSCRAVTPSDELLAIFRNAIKNVSPAMGPTLVIPAKAGVQCLSVKKTLDSSVRWNDDESELLLSLER
ncbi:hypothetical protein [Dyella sp.]|uniref:hypothetical protein n=1 Tax=Dyella sp. TaxID=1869338 RepID=UPI002FD9B279